MFKRLLLAGITVAVMVFSFPVSLRAQELKEFPRPFVSDEDPAGRRTGIYLPADTTDLELKAALLLRAKLGTETWKEDDIILGNFDALPEGRMNRILIGAYDTLPEDMRKELPKDQVPKDGAAVCYEYEDDKGTVLLITAESAANLYDGTALLLDQNRLSLISGPSVSVLPELPTEQAVTAETEAAELPLDLSLWPYPFKQDGKFQPLAVVFPDEISDTELNLLGRILALKEEALPVDVDLRIIRSVDAPQITDRNLFVIGTDEDNPYLASLNADIPAEHAADGEIRLVRSEETGRTALLISGKDEETLSYVLRYLRDTKNASSLSGDTVFIDQELTPVSMQLLSEETEKKQTAPGKNLKAALIICVPAVAAVLFGAVLLIVRSIRDRRHG